MSLPPLGKGKSLRLQYEGKQGVYHLQYLQELRRPTKKRGTLKVKCEKAFTLDTLLINKSLIKMKVVFCRQQVKSQSLN